MSEDTIAMNGGSQPVKVVAQVLVNVTSDGKLAVQATAGLAPLGILRILHGAMGPVLENPTATTPAVEAVPEAVLKRLDGLNRSRKPGGAA